MAEPFVSICIPSYNRPETLVRLLKTINSENPKEVEIVISEDASPKQAEIRAMVEKFKSNSKYSVVYRENENNLGYDGNLIELVKAASGKWIVLMGDDDEFISGGLDKLTDFIKNNPEIVYVLRRYETVHADGSVEDFRYYVGDRIFSPGEKTYEEIFRKSVFISGFAIRRDLILPHLINDFDRFGLIQIYWVAELVLKYKSAYFDTPITRQVEDLATRAKETMYEEGTKKIVSRPVDTSRSLAFMSGYPKIAKYMDAKYGFHSLPNVMRDLSKYSYPILAIHRNKGVGVFMKYAKELSKLGYNATPYYYIYAAALLVFGKNICDFCIMMIKKMLGKTPNL